MVSEGVSCAEAANATHPSATAHRLTCKRRTIGSFLSRRAARRDAGTREGQVCGQLRESSDKWLWEANLTLAISNFLRQHDLVQVQWVFLSSLRSTPARRGDTIS